MDGWNATRVGFSSVPCKAFLRDPGDEMVLEVAVGARADIIVTHGPPVEGDELPDAPKAPPA